MSALLFFAYMILYKTSTALINPTIANSSGEYYIASQSTLSFASDSIICVNINCIVICDIDKGCYKTTIDPSASETLTLICNKYQSCLYSNLINNGPSNSAQISCLNENSCMNVNYNIQNTVNVSIECSYIKCASGGCNGNQATCDHSNFNAQYSKNVNIKCNGDLFDCWGSIFNINNTDITIINVNKYNRGNQIIGYEITTELTVNCNDDHGCSEMDIYCPINAVCNINCNGIAGCSEGKFYIPSKDTPYFSLRCNASASCDDMTFICMDTELTSNYRYSVTTDNYGCLSHDCCPFHYDTDDTILDCSKLFGSGEVCWIDCTHIINGGCPIKTYINASDASVLVLTCDDENECRFMDIYPPKNGNMYIECSESGSCEYLKFHQQTISSLSLHCSHASSCGFLSIDVISTDTVNITCLGLSSCRKSHINLISTGNLISILCIGIGSCQVSLFNIGSDGNIKNVYIKGEKRVALYHTQIKIQNVDQLNFSCIAEGTDVQTCYFVNVTTSQIGAMNVDCTGYLSCSYSKWNIKANDITLHCQNHESCTNVDLITNITNSLSITTNNNTAFDSSHIDVECFQCINTFNCMENITILCGSNIDLDHIPQYEHCGYCMCSNYAVNNVFIKYDYNIWQPCILITNKPTSIPTLPTINPSFGPSYQPTTSTTSDPSNYFQSTSLSVISTTKIDNDHDDKMLRPGIEMVIIGGMGIFIIILLLVIVILCCKRHRKNKNKNKNDAKIELKSNMELGAMATPSESREGFVDSTKNINFTELNGDL